MISLKNILNDLSIDQINKIVDKSFVAGADSSSSSASFSSSSESENWSRRENWDEAGQLQILRISPDFNNGNGNDIW